MVVGSLKIKVLVDAKVQLDNGVGGRACHLAHQRHQRLEAVEALALVNQDKGGHVAKEVGADGLEGIAVVGLLQEKLNQLLGALEMETWARRVGR